MKRWHDAGARRNSWVRAQNGGAQPGWRFVTHLALPATIIWLLLAALAAAGLYWSTERSNQEAIGRQIRMADRALGASIDSLAQSQEVIAVWDEALLQVRRGLPDMRWTDVNIGFWFYNAQGHDRVYILAADERPLYAMAAGRHMAPASYDRVKPRLARLIDEIRGRAAATGHAHDLPIGNAVATLSANGVRMPGHASHISHLVLIDGRPAAASVMEIVSNSGRYRDPPHHEPLLVNIRFLDGSFLQEMARRNLIAAPRFATRDDHRAGEQALPLKAERGDVIGYIIWRPERPGSGVRAVLGPILALGLIGGSLTMLLLLAGLRRSFADLQASEAEAQHLALHDMLTGLPNRVLFGRQLDGALAACGGDGRGLALMMLDLDRFKHVNDSFGHQAGDALIREFALRLNRLGDPGDMVARVGGDEFAILLGAVTGRDAIEARCVRILEAVREAFAIAGGQAFVGVSIGYVIAPDHGRDRDDLLRKADIALYRAKAEGRDCFRAFSADMDADVRLRATVEDQLRLALGDDAQLELHFQPQLRLRDRQVTGLEALVRWRHPVRGLIPPDQFIPIAEEAGLIGALGDWVLDHACLAARRWPALTIAVNLSVLQFRSQDFAAALAARVAAGGVDPHQIELEITEGVLLDGNAASGATLAKLRAAGFRIALDDFGTGYSSLGYLRHFAVDKIKIDRSFIHGIDREGQAAAIVQAIITLGHAMQLQVCAEGVEREEQLQFLAAAGCDQVQGYLIARPCPQHEIDGVLGTLSATRSPAWRAA